MSVLIAAYYIRLKWHRISLTKLAYCIMVSLSIIYIYSALLNVPQLGTYSMHGRSEHSIVHHAGKIRNGGLHISLVNLLSLNGSFRNSNFLMMFCSIVLAIRIILEMICTWKYQKCETQHEPAAFYFLDELVTTRLPLPKLTYSLK